MKIHRFFAVVCLLLAMPAGLFAGEKFLLLSSTIGPIDAGIVGELENQFEKETGIRVRHVGAGTGEALKIATQGSVNLVLVHAKALEEQFVKDGWGTERIPLMYNDFVIVGPASDPAGVKGMKTATEALKKIAEKQVLFISRGDKSGTHVAEMDLWAKASIQPTGAWYQVHEKGAEGNGPTLKYTDEKAAYTVIDRATYLGWKDKIKLVVLVEKDDALLNYISLIPVNPAKIKAANYEEAMTFIKWLCAPEKGQKIIAEFGVSNYGSPLFFPNSREWGERKK